MPSCLSRGAGSAVLCKCTNADDVCPFRRLDGSRICEVRDVPQDDDNCHWNQRELELEQQRAERNTMRSDAERLREAIRLTREYVGERALPAVPGWEWFDAIAATGGFDGFGRCGCVLDPQIHGRPRAGDLFYCRLPAGHDGEHGQ